LCSPFLSSILTTCPTHVILFDLITRTVTGEEYRLLSFPFCSYPYFPITLSLLGPNILLNALSSNTLSLRFSLNVSDQFLHRYKTTGIITVLYIVIFKFLDSKLEDKRFGTKWKQAFPDFSLLLISFWMESWFFSVAPK
jgi:hypothetical protein